jgi:guanylate kinase
MTDFIISGTSGAGKTYLEELLEREHGFYQLVKYMDRDPRPGELDNNKVSFTTKSQFVKMKENDEFIFTLEYVGNNYGWTKEDYDKHNEMNRTMGVTLESLKDFPRKIPNFIPVMLHIEPSNFALISDRIKSRELDKEMTDQQKEIVQEKIDKRLKLAKEEYEKFDEYRTIVESNGGKIFSIESDETIHKEVIPWILENIK